MSLNYLDLWHFSPPCSKAASGNLDLVLDFWTLSWLDLLSPEIQQSPVCGLVSGFPLWASVLMLASKAGLESNTNDLPSHPLDEMLGRPLKST